MLCTSSLAGQSTRLRTERSGIRIPPGAPTIFLVKGENQIKPSYRSEDGNIVELLNIKGIEFIKTKEINFEGEIYSEFRNKDKNKIYFAIKDGEEYKEIIDENKLNRMIKENYKVKNNADIID